LFVKKLAEIPKHNIEMEPIELNTIKQKKKFFHVLSSTQKRHFRETHDNLFARTLAVIAPAFHMCIREGSVHLKQSEVCRFMMRGRAELYSVMLSPRENKIVKNMHLVFLLCSLA